MLPEIIITSKVSGLIYISDSLLGQVDKDSYQSFIGAGSFNLSFTPFSTANIYAPILMTICVQKGIPTFSCPHATLYNFKDNAYLIEIFPPILAAHSIPVCLAFARIEDRFTASIIKQNSCYMVIEDETKQLPDGFFPIYINNSPVINTMSINELSIIIVSDNTSHIYFFVRNDNGFNLSHSMDAQEFKIENDRIIITKTTAFGHIVENIYSVKNKQLVLSSSSYKANPLIPSDIASDFLECVRLGIEQKALSYLSSDLDLSFNELREFLGNFTEVKKSPFDDNAYALIEEKNQDSIEVCRFAFEIVNKHIHNIKEL